MLHTNTHTQNIPINYYLYYTRDKYIIKMFRYYVTIEVGI